MTQWKMTTMPTTRAPKMPGRPSSLIKAGVFGLMEEPPGGLRGASISPCSKTGLAGASFTTINNRQQAEVAREEVVAAMAACEGEGEVVLGINRHPPGLLAKQVSKGP